MIESMKKEIDKRFLRGLLPQELSSGKLTSFKTLGENAFLDVSWSIADGADRKKPALVTKRSRYKEPTEGRRWSLRFSASRNLASLSRDIAGRSSNYQSDHMKKLYKRKEKIISFMNQ